jgi:hypothetical protein
LTNNPTHAIINSRKEKRRKKMLNTIYTNEEYMAQGFTAQEVPMIREHDILFNEYQLGKVGEEALERIEELANILGL